MNTKKALLLLLSVAMVLLVGCKKDNVDIIDVQVTPTPQATPTPTPSPISMIAEGKWHLLGLRKDGMVLAAGDNKAGQCNVDSWTDVVYISAAGDNSAAVKRDGTVLIAGAIYDSCSEEVAKWVDIVSVALGDKHIIGLKSDGKVVAAGNNDQGQCDVSTWTGVTEISASGNYTEAKTASGVLTTGSKETDDVFKNIDATLNTDGTVSINGRYTDMKYLTANWNLKSSGERPVPVDPNAEKLAEAKNANPDTIGYININNTGISHPIMFDEWKKDKDWFYNTHTPEKKAADSGSIYALVTDEVSLINTITGHNSRVSGAMFHELHHIQEFNNGETKCQYSKCTNPELESTLPDLTQYSDRVWNITAYGHSRWEIFSMYEVKAKEPETTLYYNTNFTNATTESNIDMWINTQINRSEIDFGIVPPKDSTFMCLYTCGTNYDYAEAQSRLYFFLYAVD